MRAGSNWRHLNGLSLGMMGDPVRCLPKVVHPDVAALKLQHNQKPSVTLSDFSGVVLVHAAQVRHQRIETRVAGNDKLAGRCRSMLADVLLTPSACRQEQVCGLQRTRPDLSSAVVLRVRIDDALLAQVSDPIAAILEVVELSGFGVGNVVLDEQSRREDLRHVVVHLDAAEKHAPPPIDGPRRQQCLPRHFARLGFDREVECPPVHSDNSVFTSPDSMSARAISRSPGTSTFTDRSHGIS